MFIISKLLNATSAPTILLYVFFIIPPLYDFFRIGQKYVRERRASGAARKKNIGDVDYLSNHIFHPTAIPFICGNSLYSQPSIVTSWM